MELLLCQVFGITVVCWLRNTLACMTAVTGLWLNIIYTVALGGPIIDSICLVQKMCIYFSVMIITTVLIMHGQVQWRGQLVMHHDVLTVPLIIPSVIGLPRLQQAI